MSDWPNVPLVSMFNIPETFGKALSYEGQIHAICGRFNEITESYNQSLEYINEFFPWKFADPIQWNIDTVYEPYTVVYDEGTFASYVSMKAVPAGILITNTDYWMKTADYNALVELYRDEVESVANDLATEITARTNADTALGTRITNEITARTNADTALGNRITNEVTALNNAIDDIYDEPEHWVIIGDSYSYGQTSALEGVTMWYTYITGASGTRRNVTLHNYARAGAGFVHSTGTPFPTQATQAANDTSYDHRKVTRVIVFGGINDIASAEPVATVQSNALTTFETLSTAFPDAEHTFYAQWYPNKLTRANKHYLNTMMQSAAYRGFTVNDELVYLLMNCNPASYYVSDGVHPNSSGMGMIAAVISGKSSYYERPYGPLGYLASSKVFKNIALNAPYSNGSSITETQAGYDDFEFRRDIAHWFIRDKRATIAGISQNSQPIIIKWDIDNTIYQYWSDSAQNIGTTMIGANEQLVTGRCYIMGRICYLMIEPQSGTWSTSTLTLSYSLSGSFIID